MLFLFLLLWTEPSNTVISIESLYKPLSSNKVAMGANQEWYVLDSESMKVHRFDRNGTLLNSFAGAGEGPGELRFPDNIVVFDGAVYVTDFYRGTQVYSMEGEFLFSRRHTTPFVLLDIVEQGWVYEISDPQAGDAEIFWADKDLKESVSLIKYATTQPEMFFKLSEQGVQVTYQPGQETPNWHIGKARKNLYVFIPGTDNLVVIDLLKKQITGNLSIPLQRVPMNKGWANAQAEKIKDRITLNGKRVSVSVEKIIPDTFPLISDFRIDPSGNIWLMDGPSLTRQTVQAHVMTHDGTALTTDLPAADLQRLVGLDGEKVWFLAFDKQKEKASIRSCHRNLLRSELAKYPNDSGDGDEKPIDIRTQ